MTATDVRKCAIDLSKLSIEAYRLPEDGRKWRRKCQCRRAVAGELAVNANPDGSGITKGVPLIAKLLGMSESTVRLYFLDLIKLGLLTNEKRLWRGNRVRKLNVAVLSSSEIGASSSSEIEGNPPRLEFHPPRLTLSSSEIGASSSEIGASSSEIGDIENNVNTVDSAVTTNLGGCTALPLLPPPTAPTGNSRERREVAEDKTPTIVVNIEAVVEKLSYIFSKKFQQALREHKTDRVELARLLKRTKEEVLMEAWKLYLYRTDRTFVGEGKTICPLYIFLKEARNWLDMVRLGERVVDDGAPATKEQMAATKLKWKHDWCAANPGHEVIDGEIVETEEHKKLKAEQETDPDALFEEQEIK